MDQSKAPYQITTGVWMVPCLVDKMTKRFRPVSRPFSALKNKEKLDTRKSWTIQEDEILKNIIDLKGPKNWSAVAVEVNELAHSGLPLRKGKQCRERWLGHLNPNIRKSDWSEQEDAVLIIKQAIFGNRWSEITNYLPGRTENQIKNRWRRLDKISKRYRPENGLSAFEGLPLDFMLKQEEIEKSFRSPKASSTQGFHYLHEVYD